MSALGDDNVFLKIATVTLTLERSNSNLFKILSCLTLNV